ncbi:ATP-dependent Clp protease adapter protein ClpS [Paraoerskovia sediminicola]|uniref:ATP-dependent Clp protease adapter protein ClpS n=2 Tax=Paraoerskovia sediminicola TaxID=1138587 RepID=A0ABN6X819_9CELL|nr:ATP-dependent Clp protease adapter ClpS [Paraoerskovia sediminicola]BDZ40856.1 ATP-dependent Clp protease adapter protein ClpS [Paraoerskovia sediminicola]
MTETAYPDVSEDVRTDVREDEAAQTGATADAWQTVVWNDPVNLMSYVTYVFRSYFGYDEAHARRLMLQVHEEGRSVVSRGSREKVEVDVQAMHGFGLWATMQRAAA